MDLTVYVSWPNALLYITLVILALLINDLKNFLGKKLCDRIWPEDAHNAPERVQQRIVEALERAYPPSSKFDDTANRLSSLV
ncbi:hypothetical protein LTR09_006874 [Extremus antarcticus]|uniref:Uncharacterized protein n=1 Tax=Extremus antarcticus TaxID=702011 RepID=A0AAJ0DK24_9PEZI|nr:hypothetical protein LTR09_006874 [Extremus antarcticus]